MPFSEPNALQLRVMLQEIEPLVWRRLIVPASWHLGQLHLVIQAAFNWWNYHLHEFHIGGLRYGDPDTGDGEFENGPKLFDQAEVQLRDFGREPGTTFTYLYDFGDDWHHVVEIEQHLVLNLTPKLALCVDGAQARPPEDVGGVPGYESFLAVMADPGDSEHASTRRWCGGHFDPSWFDLAMVDKDVRNALRPNVRRRQFQSKPRREKQPG